MFVDTKHIKLSEENIITKEYYSSIFLDTFKDLLFEEQSHSYYLSDKSKKLKYSVSGLIKKFTPEFDTQSKSLGTAIKTGKTQQQVLQEWEDKKNKACDLGSITHIFGENYMFNRTLQPSSKFEEAIVSFWQNLPSYVIPVFSELQMYCKKHLFAGTADIILYNKLSKTFILADYKTNEDLFKNFKGEKLLGQFSHLLNNNFNKYQIQLSFYEYLFNQTGFEVSSRKIVWLKPDGKFELYDTENFKPQIINFLQNGI